MSRKSWVYTSDGRCIEKGTAEHEAYLGERYGDAPMIAPDEGSFVSPIDGLAYSGRAGMKEHNKRHDVVNNRDLVGLPYFHERARSSPAGVRDSIIEAAKRKGHL